MKLKGITLTILSAIMFGISPVFGSLSYTLGSNPMTLTFYRNFFVVPVVGIIMLCTKKSFKLNKKEVMWIVIIGIFGRACTTISLYSAYTYVGIGISTTLHFLYPVIVALICKIVFKEKLGWLRIAGLAVALMGITLFIDTKGNISITGVMLALFSAVMFAFCMVALDKTGLAKMEQLKLTFYISAVIAATTYVFSLLGIGDRIIFNLAPKAMLYSFIVAMMASFIGTAFLTLGIRYIGSAPASFLSMLEPLGCVISGWLFLNESMTATKVLGCALILSAVFLVVFADNKKRCI